MGISLAQTSGAEPQHSGVFLTFEGIDGSGKSTQAHAAAAHLRALGHEVVETFEPGDSALGRELRKLLLHAGTMSNRTEALLYAADRAEHVAEIVAPALARGAVVVSDRYIDSSIAYQGAGRDLQSDDIAAISHWATNGLQPDRTYVFDLDVSTAQQRRTGTPDRLEAEAESFHQNVRDGFLTIAAADPSRVVVIDAARDIARISSDVTSDVDAYMASVRQP